MTNDKFGEIIDYKFGRKENVCVLYNGVSFKNTNGVIFIGIYNFLRILTKEKDVDRTFALLSADLPIKDRESEVNVQDDKMPNIINC